MVRIGMAALGMAGMEWMGRAMVWNGEAGQAGLGVDRRGEAGQGSAGGAWQERQRAARQGTVGRGSAGGAWQKVATSGMARFGRQGEATGAGIGAERRGRIGKARLG